MVRTDKVGCVNPLESFVTHVSVFQPFQCSSSRRTCNNYEYYARVNTRGKQLEVKQ